MNLTVLLILYEGPSLSLGLKANAYHYGNDSQMNAFDYFAVKSWDQIHHQQLH